MVKNFIIKPAHKKHSEGIATIERAIWSAPMDHKAVGKLLTEPEGDGFIAAEEKSDYPVGYLLYRSIKRRYVIAGMGVLPTWRGQGIGSHLMQPLNDRLLARRADAIWCAVSQESAALPAQLFLRACGFRVIDDQIWLPRWSKEGTVPGYQFERTADAERADGQEVVLTSELLGLTYHQMVASV